MFVHFQTDFGEGSARCLEFMTSQIVVSIGCGIGYMICPVVWELSGESLGRVMGEKWCGGQMVGNWVVLMCRLGVVLGVMLGSARCSALSIWFLGGSSCSDCVGCSVCVVLSELCCVVGGGGLVPDDWVSRSGDLDRVRDGS